MGKSLCPKGDAKRFSVTSGWIVGLDEVGAGSLAGPLCVTAYAIPAESFSTHIPLRVFDSKKLTSDEREAAAIFLKKIPGVRIEKMWLEVEAIEKLNIYWARMYAFWELILKLDKTLESKAVYLVDGPKLARKKDIPLYDELELSEVERRIFAQSKADSEFFTVAAASILAKVARDTLMRELSQDFPEYAWEKNKGYATPDHIGAIRKHALTAHHRKSFCKNFSNSEDLVSL